MGSHVVICEIDENQHKQYDRTCETVRMSRIVYGLGIPTVFIRYNPHGYQTDDKKYDPVFKVRMNILEGVISKWIVTVPTEFLTTEYLYYDNY
jgi:hypothetical protein